MAMKLGQIARLFWLAGAIGIVDINPVLSQEAQITPILREERASRPFDEEKKLLDPSILSYPLEDERLIFGLTPSESEGSQEAQTPPTQGEIISVTGVQLNPTETGIELILQTPTGAAELLQPNNVSSGNNFIVEIPNARLQLPSGKPFRQANPVQGISEVTVTNQEGNIIRVTAAGETASPQVELFDSDEGLIFGLTAVEESAQTPPTQSPTQGEIVSVTGVQLNPTETGIELILQTPTGVAEQLQPNNVSSGNNFIVDIPNAQLQLPSGKPFRQEKPIEGISEITVTNFDVSTIRINATGETVQPQVELFDSDEGLIFGFTPVENSAQTPIPQPEEVQIVSIDRVQLNQTETGFEIILLTPTGTAQQLRVVNVSEGNSFIAEIPNAQLRLPDGQPFRSENPLEGVSEVTVTNQNENTVRVTAVGEEKQPTVELFDSKEGLIFSAVGDAESAQAEEDIELVVTGEQDGYAVPNSSVGTLTDVPLRDVPQSIQVIPRQVIEDQGANDIEEVLRNVSSLSQQGGDAGREINIRGLSATDNIISDGIEAKGGEGQLDFDLSNIEQVEVLKGPSSVLYGSGEPGGVINIVTKQPLENPFYEITGTIGNFDRYRGAVDLTGPLTENKTILYRLNASYNNEGSFVDFVESEELGIFPVLSFRLGDNTTLALEGRYENQSEILNSDLPVNGTILNNPLGQVPRDRFLGEPDFNRFNTSQGDVGYRLNHRFSDRWSLRNQFRASFYSSNFRAVFVDGLEADNRTVIRSANKAERSGERYTLQTDVNAEVQTGIVNHNLLFGLELEREIANSKFIDATNTPSIDLFEPEYGNLPSFDNPEPSSEETITSHTIGVYAQNLLSIGDRVKILLGGRFDWAFQNSEDLLASSSAYSEDDAFSPRVGIVYQPIDPVSLYAGWSRSFNPQSGVDREGNPFVPIEGEQFEIGVKTEFLDGRLIATLAAYQITRQNDFQPDPVDPENFSIQIGEQRSRGIDFDVIGEPLPGLRLIASYAYIDAIITEDTTGLEGNQLGSVPQHSGSFWAVYELQEGTLEGLGFGAGIFASSDFPVNSENLVDAPGYVRTDALLYYRRDNWRVQLNIENLFDTEYFETPFGGVVYGTPFTIRGRVSVEF